MLETLVLCSPLDFYGIVPTTSNKQTLIMITQNNEIRKKKKLHSHPYPEKTVNCRHSFRVNVYNIFCDSSMLKLFHFESI